MPKAKRNKQISLTKTRKNAMELKKTLVDKMRSCVDQYANIFVFRVSDMRNSKLKEIREECKHSRFFLGKNKVMAIALGRTPADEYQMNLSRVSNRLRGQCGLLFSNRSKEDVMQWLDSYADSVFARSGNLASFTVNLPEGPLPDMHHSMEPYVRSLGMPTKLEKGVVHLVKEYLVCNVGEVLTPEKAKILELLGHKMGEFRINLDSHWAKNGTFTIINDKIPELESKDEVMDVEGDSANKADDDDNESDEELATDESDKDASNEVDEVANEEPVLNLDAVADDRNVITTNGTKSHNTSQVDNGDNTIKKDEGPEKESSAEQVEDEVEEPQPKPKGRRSTIKRKLTEGTPITRKFRKIPEKVVESSPDEKSPLFRSLRNRTVKVKRKN